MTDLAAALEVTSTVFTNKRYSYCIINNSSATWSIWGWRNGAVANVAPQSWQPLGGVIQGLTPRTLSGYRFVDLNGDHKDDCTYTLPQLGEPSVANIHSGVGG